MRSLLKYWCPKRLGNKKQYKVLPINVLRLMDNFWPPLGASFASLDARTRSTSSRNSRFGCVEASFGLPRLWLFLATDRGRNRTFPKAVFAASSTEDANRLHSPQALSRGTWVASM
jgi:hypothetical protein